MDTKLKTVVLEDSRITVKIAQSITYGEHRAIQSVLFKGAKGDISGGGLAPSFDFSVTNDYEVKKILTVVKEATGKGGDAITVDNAFLDGLSVADGKQLEAEANEVVEGIKKN